MGLAYSDDFMGPLTLSPNLIREKDGKVDVLVNVRMPRGKTPEALPRPPPSASRPGVPRLASRWRWSTRQGNWMARDPKGAWLATLLNTFGDTHRPRSQARAHGRQHPPAKLMPNAINLALPCPGKKYTAHNAKEFKEVAELDADMQMFTEMLVRIGNLQQMQ